MLQLRNFFVKSADSYKSFFWHCYAADGNGFVAVIDINSRGVAVGSAENAVFDIGMTRNSLALKGIKRLRNLSVSRDYIARGGVKLNIHFASIRLFVNIYIRCYVLDDIAFLFYNVLKLWNLNYRNM